MKIDTITIIRWILTSALMLVVWFNSHWSVALSLTLISISVEMVKVVLDIALDVIKTITNSK